MSERIEKLRNTIQINENDFGYNQDLETKLNRLALFSDTPVKPNVSLVFDDNDGVNINKFTLNFLVNRLTELTNKTHRVSHIPHNNYFYKRAITIENSIHEFEKIANKDLRPGSW